MQQPPRDPRQAILSGPVARATLGYATLISLTSLLALAWGLARPGGGWEHAGTLTFMTLAFAQIFHLGNARSSSPVLRPARVVANPYALAAVVLTAGLQILAVESPWLARVLRTQALSVADWGVVVGLALIPAGVGQMLKVIAGTRRRPVLSTAA
jgi:Ca2+-transporting ATPase